MTIILMNISSMSILKTHPCILKWTSTLLISKSIIYFIMNEDNLCCSLNLTYISTLINTSFRIELLSCSMSDYFLLSCISLCTSITIRISNCTCMKSSFIVITYYMETKMSINISCLIIRRLKIHSMLNIA